MKIKNNLKVYFLVFSLLVVGGVVAVTNVVNTVAVTHNSITGAVTAIEPTSSEKTFTINYGTSKIEITADGARKKEYSVTANSKGTTKVELIISSTSGIDSKIMINGDKIELKDGSILIVNAITSNSVRFLLTSFFTNVELFNENTIKSTLLYGVEGEYTIKGKNFDVIPTYKEVGSKIEVEFFVNGERTDFIKTPTPFTLEDGSIIIASVIDKDLVQFTLELRAPDLIVESITLNPTNPIAGQSVTITYTVKNVGNNDAVDYVLSVEYGDRNKGSSSETRPIPPGESIPESLLYNYPKPGTYTIKIRASDSRDLNKDNDELTKTIVVSTKSTIGITEQNFFDSSIDLVNGWNLISVTPGMVGKSISQMSNADSIPKANRCEIIDPVWIFSPNVWKLVKPSSGKYMKSPFDRAVDVVKLGVDHKYLGMWVKVENPSGCRLGCGTNSCVSGVG